MAARSEVCAELLGSSKAESATIAVEVNRQAFFSYRKRSTSLVQADQLI